MCCFWLVGVVDAVEYIQLPGKKCMYSKKADFFVALLEKKVEVMEKD